jgi:serine-type D-Ala-D-Ala carboxypeptidase (penicillin-binding protein 5/6)
MSTNRQLGRRRGGAPLPAAPARRTVGRSWRPLAVVVVLAATLANQGGSWAAPGAPPAPIGAAARVAVAGGSWSGASHAAPGAQAGPAANQAATGAQPAAAAQVAAGARPAPAANQPAPGADQAAVAAPRVAAKAVILADESTGQVLFERNAGAARAMASTTKVMTALLALERLDERRVVAIGPGPTKVGEESLRLRQGERLSVRQLLLGLMLKSANDAGVALAEAVDGSEAAFVRRMNRKAAALRLGATRYVTPYGLDRPGHQTSARDLARLWEVAMRRADFRALVATRAARLPGGPLSLRRFVTTNQLLGSYRWTVGGKTGFTNRAGRCLVASASRGGRRLVAVALGSPDAFADVRTLFEYGFSKFVRVRVAGRGQPVSAAPGRPAALQADGDVDALVRLDHLDQVRLLPAPGRAAEPGGSGGPADAVTAWFAAGGRRLARVRLTPLASTGPAPPATPPPAGPSAGSTPGSEGPPGATLTLGSAVRVWPVPPGAPAPAIDPFLRRSPP